MFFLHRFRELDALKKPKISESGGGTSRDPSASPSSAAAGGQTTESNGFKIPDVPKPATAAGGEAIEDWTGEVRARHCHKYFTSFRKLCQFYFAKRNKKDLRKFAVILPVFRIRIHLIRTRICIQHFRLNTDLDWVRIQGFDDQKLQNLQLKKKY
jgi:hypothetical protein